MYKKSKYNIFVPCNDGTIVFNALTGSIGIFDKNTMDKYKSGQYTLQEMGLLVKKGIFVDKNYDEWDKMDKDRANGILDDKSKYVRIWTTSDCNARCYYCYEKGIQKEWLAERTADRIVEFIDEMLNGGDRLYIEWFGGEPLMNPGIIDYIMNKLESILKAKNIQVESKIITNGSFITEEMVDRMVNLWQTKMVQVTLDGAFEEYDKVKNYIDKSSHTFERVIRNIHLLADNGIHVAIRMNYNMQNYSQLSRLIDYIAKEFKDEKHIYAYVYPIWNCLNSENEGRFRSKAHADYRYVLLLKQLVKQGLGNVRDIARLNYRANQCRSCSVYGHSIFPNGRIGKCSETFVQTIGDIWNGVQDVETERKWTSLEVDEKCRDCQFMPLCQGGCRSSMFTDMQQCYVNKDVFPELLRWYVQSLKEEKIATTSA